MPILGGSEHESPNPARDGGHRSSPVWVRALVRLLRGTSGRMNKVFPHFDPKDPRHNGGQSEDRRN